MKDDLNKMIPIPESAIIMLLDMENMFLLVNNERWLLSRIGSWGESVPPTDCIAEVLDNNNTVFSNEHLTY